MNPNYFISPAYILGALKRRSEQIIEDEAAGNEDRAAQGMAEAQTLLSRLKAALADSERAGSLAARRPRLSLQGLNRSNASYATHGYAAIDGN